MRNLKKVCAIILAMIMVYYVNLTAFAEEGIAAISETVDIEMETADLGDFIKDKESWGINNGMELSFKNGSITSNNDATAYYAYTKDSFADKLVQYKQVLKLKKENGESTWGGFAVRCTTYGAPIWSKNNKGYLVVVKESQIELQRYSKSGAKFLVIIPNEYIKDGVAHNISAGAVNADGGVNVFLFVDGKCAINYFDTDDEAVTTGEYYNIYATKGSSISSYDGDKIPSIPAMAKISGKAEAGEKFSADYAIVSFGGKSEGQYSVNWYYNKEYVGKLSEFDTAQKEEFNKYNPSGEYSKLIDSDASHTITEEELGGYYYIAIKDTDGNIVHKSTPVIVNNVEYILNQSVVLLIDCEYSFIKGKKVQIDPEDYDVMPSIIGGRTLVPVRFVAESFGADVSWNGETREAEIKLEDKTIVMKLGSTKYTVNGKEAELDVPAQVVANRTMVPVRVISEAFGKSVLWDGENELVIISDEDLGIKPENDKDTFEDLCLQVLKRP